MFNQFTSQLGNLVNLLLESQSHFVKCIKPNKSRLPAKVDSHFVVEQLQASGLLEAIKIHTTGYEFRESIESFVDKFWPLTIQPKSKIQDAHVTFLRTDVSFSQGKTQESSNNLPPGSLEEYVHRIFDSVAKGVPDSPAHPVQK